MAGIVTVARVVVGSRLQGLALADSDTDVRRVWMLPLSAILSPWPPPEPTLDDAEDGWELRHFVSLLAKGNPTVLEVLHSDLNLEPPRPCGARLRALAPSLLDPAPVHRSFASYVMSARGAAGSLPVALVPGTPLPDDRRSRKHAVTALRVARQGVTLLRGGRFDAAVPPTDRDLLMAIRRDGLAVPAADEWRQRPGRVGCRRGKPRPVAPAGPPRRRSLPGRRLPRVPRPPGYDVRRLTASVHPIDVPTRPTTTDLVHQKAGTHRKKWSRGGSR